jgi:hypothetical protein
MIVLMDFCLHDIRQDGRNAIERFLEETPPPAESDEMAYLQALKEATFSVFLIEGVEPGVGIQARDAMRGDSRFVMDVVFSKLGHPGEPFVGRLMSTRDITMTTGAFMLLAKIPAQRQAAWQEEFQNVLKSIGFNQFSPETQSDLNRRILRKYLAEGAAPDVSNDPFPKTGRRQIPRASAPPVRIGRNAPCPCGSGKKFKHCCGGRH